MGKDEFISELVDEYRHDAEKVEKDWQELLEHDLIKSIEGKGKDVELYVYRMLCADYSIADVGRTETFNIYVLQPSGAYQTQDGRDMANVSGLGGIPAQKKFGLIRIIALGRDNVNAMLKLQRGKLYKAELGVGEIGDKIMTAWWQDNSKAEMHKGEMPPSFKDPIVLLDKVFKQTVPIMDYKKYIGKDGTSPTLMIEGQVVTSTVRKKKKGGQYGKYFLRDDSMTREDFVQMGGGLGVLVPPEMIDCGKRSTVRAVGNFIMFQSENSPDAEPRVSFNADAIVPIFQFKIEKDTRSKIPVGDVKASETGEGIDWVGEGGD